MDEKGLMKYQCVRRMERRRVGVLCLVRSMGFTFSLTTKNFRPEN